ncbi:hypothetical protein ASD15_06170 [Massilia sp. Root351]|uniref:hypothetical protein n=1 Tax=Massilia sp. Root351 TaxID=1736522 RepID=UPI00070B3CF5|nr:hypothetical protein [Massilia sp. Root351]KQV84750.1 hypothetical protein ASD15_06170 [Massilia sp. Root351]
MSGKDHDQLDDAAFAAFLQGDDPLARDLAALDQPAPAPALDAAIQARIAAALAAEKLAALPAANDPVAAPATAPALVPASVPALAAAAPAHAPAPAHAQAPLPGPAPTPSGPRWQSRWQLPLALAAGVAAISVALPLWQAHDPVTEASVAAAPAPATAPSAQPAPPASAAAEAPAAAAASPVADAVSARVPAPQAKQANAKAQAGDGAALPATPPAKPAVNAVERKSGLEDAVIAEDVANAPPQKSGLGRYSRSAPASTAQTTQMPVAAASGAVVTSVIANASNVRPSAEHGQPLTSMEKSATASIDYRTAPRIPAAAPAPPAPPPPPAPAPAPATMAFAPMAPVVAPAPAPRAAPEQVSISGSRILAPHEMQPKAWLEKIEDLLKANEREEAIAEWQKFRAAYPAYPVPDKLSESFPPPVK